MGDAYIRDTNIGDTYIGVICIKGTYIEGVCIGIVSAIKRLGIYLQLFQISEIKLLYMSW